jgi:chromosomal replication initiation ATPase DnaA
MTNKTPHTPTFITIVDYVASFHNIPPSLLDQSGGKTRRREIVELRYMCFYFCRALTRASIETIGTHFHTDRGSVPHGLRKCKALREAYPPFDQKVSSIESDLKAILKIASSPDPVAAADAYAASFPSFATPK